MKIQIWGKSKCFDTKKAERYFKERRIKYQYVDLPRYGMGRRELESVKNASLGLMTINSLVAADCVIIPTQPAFLSVKGLNLLMQTVSTVKRQINPSLKIEGVLFTMVNNRTNEAKDIILTLRTNYHQKMHVFRTEIPFSVRAAETSAKGKSIFAHDKNGKVAEAYRALTKEVLSLERERQAERSRTDPIR